MAPILIAPVYEFISLIRQPELSGLRIIGISIRIIIVQPEVLVHVKRDTYSESIFEVKHIICPEGKFRISFIRTAEYETSQGVFQPRISDKARKTFLFGR